MAILLRQSNLNQLPQSIDRPAYDRGALKPGIIHIGIGNFHRAHLAVYLHKLFQRDENLDWAIVGAGVREGDKRMQSLLAEQDWLTTIVELDPDAETAIVTGSMIDFVDVDPDALIQALCAPEIRIVSLTITEGGYFVDAKTNEFDRHHDDLQSDAGNIDSPRTVFGILIAALKQRRQQGIAPFTVMSCDNLPGNGHVARAAITGLAHLCDQNLAQWIDENVAFPNSMVDCITPATSDFERNLVETKYAIKDNWPVTCEPFRQWVLEDQFPAGRPAFEKVGAQFVDDVIPFELMKLRILNGGHAALAYPSALLDIEKVHDSMTNSLIRNYLDKLERTEIIPAVPEVPDTNLYEYYDIIAERFANPKINDTIERLCHDGSNRQPKFIVPTIRDRLKAGQSVDGLALVSALWCRYCAGTSDTRKVIPLDDSAAQQLTLAAHQSKENPLVFLQQKNIYGDLSDNELFCASFATALDALWTNGTAATLQRYAQT